jgi:type II secretory pathway component PulL
MNPLHAPKKLTRLARGPIGTAGVFFGRAGLELALAKSSGGHVIETSQGNVAVESSPDAAEMQSRWQVAAASFRPRVDPREHRVVTAVGCEDVVCRALTLPSTDRDELEQMLALQIDHLTPLPLEDVVYSFETIEVVNGQSVVLVAIARKEAVNARVEALETAGLPPQIVTVDVLAMFRGLMWRNLLPQGDQLHTLMVFGAGGVHIVVHSRGLPVAVRSLVFGDELLKSAGGRGALREEWQRTLVAVESEQTRREIGTVTFAAWGEGLRSTAQELAAEWDVPAESVTNGAAPSPAFSLCLEAEAGKQPLNLLPEEWRERRRSAQMRLRMVRGAIAVGVVYVIALSIVVGLLKMREAQTRRVAGEIQRLTAEFGEARGLHGTLVAMQKQLDMKHSALEVLREVTALMPENVKLNYFVFKKDQTVSIKGQAPSSQVIYEFVGRVERSDLFTEVKPGPVSTDRSGLTRFDILCTLKTAAGGPTGGPWR